MRWKIRYGVRLAAVACLLLTGAAAAQEAGGRPLAAILKDLGNDQFAVRDRTQAELAKVPRSQFNALREAVKEAKDEEVKARLRMRIGELAREPLVQPPKLSVDLKNATLAEVANTLNTEMGLPFIQLDAGVAAPRVTLKVQEQPLWEILRQLNAQAPIAVSSGALVTPPARPINTINLALPTERAPARPIYVTDGVCTVPYVAPRGGVDGNLAIGCIIYTDPRVRLTRYESALRVEKAVDQDGRIMTAVSSESPTMSLPLGLVSKFELRATFVQDPALKVIKEMRATAVAEVLESEDIATIDLTQEQKEPLVTPLGQFTLEKKAARDFTLRLEPASPDAPTSAPVPTVRLVYDKGDMMLLRPMGSGNLSWDIRGGFGSSMGPRTAAMVEIILSQKTREVTLPVVITNLDLQASTVSNVRSR